MGIYDGDPHGFRLLIGACPVCSTAVAGTQDQLDFAGFDAEEDRWSDVVRVYPSPPKVYSSFRIPGTVSSSLAEADKAMQAGAHMAACVMFGRALEAVCRDMLRDDAPDSPEKRKKHLMLSKGIKELREKKIIDDRLYDWSQHLQAFRNLAAHPDEDFTASRQDVEDLQAFVQAIVEYVYDLADRYAEFKARVARQEKRKRPPEAQEEMDEP